MHAAGNDPRYRLVAVANQHFFALLHELDVSAELRFQVANVYGTHTHIVTNLTMLVISSVGIRLDNGNPEILLHSISRYYRFLPGEQQQAFLDNLREKAS